MKFGTKARQITVTVNGKTVAEEVEPRLLLADFLRHQLRLTGTHVGCAHGACGACTILLDGRPTRSCLTFAVQADRSDIRTVESLGDGEHLSVLQQQFKQHHALQCGFCTPGMLISATSLLAEVANPSEEQIREYMAGNLCRCTGYTPIVKAIRAAATSLSVKDNKDVLESE